MLFYLFFCSLIRNFVSLFKYLSINQIGEPPMNSDWEYINNWYCSSANYGKLLCNAWGGVQLLNNQRIRRRTVF